MFEIGAWICVGLIVYTYLGYPVLAAIAGGVGGRAVAKASIQPEVVVVIAAYNEELEIEQTIRNKLSQNYPESLLKVLIVSDGSTDSTEAIVQSLVSEFGSRVNLVRQWPRQGKTQALNLAVSLSKSDVIVFSDANSIYDSSAVRALVQNFADRSVGYVTGRMSYRNPTESAVGAGSGTYMGYENTLRQIETRLGSIVGADGGIDAVRRELYVPMRPDQLPDFVLPLSVVQQGKRVVYEPDAVVYENALSSARDEFRMRVRVALRALWAIFDRRALLNPFRHPVFAWQLISHKVLRYLAFVPLGGLFALSGAAATSASESNWRWVFGCELLLLLAALCGHYLKDSPAIASKLRLPYYFAILNLACLFAFWKFLNRQRMTMWKPRGGA